MNIDEMPAGREMDALVAEKVMGYLCVCDEEPRDCPIHAKSDQDTLLSYSTDIADAWIMMEKMRFVIGSHHGLHGGLHPCDGWLARKGTVFALAKTAPLAICRVALKLTMEEDKCQNG